MDFLAEFLTVAQQTLTTVSQSSARIYAHTYRIWIEWCLSKEFNPLDMSALVVVEFLKSRYETKSTRSRHLSALRSLCRYRALDYTRPELHSMYEALKLVKSPRDNLREDERDRIILHPPEIEALFAVWGDVQSPVHIRNRTIFMTLLYTGLRRSELAALRWDDIDFVDGILRVRNGKGGRYREVTIVANKTETMIRLLIQWKLTQSHLWNGGHGVPEGVVDLIDRPLDEVLRYGVGGKLMSKSGPVAGLLTGAGPEYAFTAFRKGPRIHSDSPISTRSLGRLNEDTRDRLEMMFRLHDMRRTHLTALLDKSPISDVQAQAGHRRASTTIELYAVPASARKRRESFTLPY